MENIFQTGFDINTLKLIIVVVLAILFFDFILGKIKKHKQSKENRKRIIKIWGKTQNRKYIDSDFASLSDYFLYKTESNKFTHVIDDLTWNDLDLNKLFAKINSTLSTLGSNILYFMLKTPVFKEEILMKRDRYIDFFAKAKDERMKLQDIIINIGEEKSGRVIEFILNGKTDEKSKMTLYVSMLCFFIFSIIGLAIQPKYFLYVFMVSIILNIIVYYRTSENRQDKLTIIKYISKIVVASKEIYKLDISEVDEYNVKLKKAYKKLRPLHLRMAIILKQLDLDILSFLKVFLLLEVIAYESMKNHIYKYREEVIETFETIGYIDALISIASFRESLNYYVKPKLTNENKDLYIDCEEIYHPLMKDPVINSIETKNSILLTGSNATGKSTFLKAVAVNSILAQSLYTCTAKKYESNYFKTYTSMALKDNLLNNESYFIVEIKSVKRILDNIDSSIPTLCFIDEILRGTNTIERIAASSQVLKHLSNQHCLCFAATHDIELTDMLKRHFENYHFQEKIINNKVIFDYKLYKDKTKSRNAIKLLEVMGYDKSIIDDALLSIDEFNDKNEWVML